MGCPGLIPQEDIPLLIIPNKSAHSPTGNMLVGSGHDSWPIAPIWHDSWNISTLQWGEFDPTIVPDHQSPDPERALAYWIKDPQLQILDPRPYANVTFEGVLFELFVLTFLVVHLTAIYPRFNLCFLRIVRYPFGYLLRNSIQQITALAFVMFFRGMQLDRYIIYDIFTFFLYSIGLQCLRIITESVCEWVTDKCFRQHWATGVTATVLLYFCLITPIYEELAKRWMYYEDSFAFLELFAGYPLLKSHRVFPFIFHLGVSGIEETDYRIILHMAWNFCVFALNVNTIVGRELKIISIELSDDPDPIRRLKPLWIAHSVHHYSTSLPFATIPASFLSPYHSLFERTRAIDTGPALSGLRTFITNFILKCMLPISFTLKDAERFATFLVSFALSRDKASMISVIAQYGSSITDDLLVVKVKDVIRESSSFFFKESNAFSDGWKAFSAKADWILDGASNFAGSDMFHWLRTIVTACLCIPVFNKMGLVFHAKRFSLFDREVFRASEHDGANFLISVVKSMKSICDVGVAYITGEGGLEAFRCSSPFSVFMRQADELVKMQHFTCVGEQKEGFIEANAYRLNLESAILTGRTLTASSTGLDPGTRAAVARKLTELDYIETRFHVQDLAKSKDPAFILLTVAPPGTGKTIVTKAAHKIMMEAYGMAYDKSAVGVIDTSHDFQDHITNGTQIIHIEEVGIETPDAMKSNGVDCTTKYLLLYGDSFPQVVNKSHLDAKGKTINLNKFVTGNTNSFDINAQLYTKFPSAVYRRITFQEVMVKPEFLKDGPNGTKLKQPDPEKMKAYCEEKGLPISNLIGYRIRFVTFDYNAPNFHVVNGSPNHRKDGPWLNFEDWGHELRRLVLEHRSRCEAGNAAMDEVLTPTCPHGSWSSICTQCIDASSSLQHEADLARFVAVPSSTWMKFFALCDLLWRIFLYVMFILSMWSFSALWWTGAPQAVFTFFTDLLGASISRYIEGTRCNLYAEMNRAWHTLCDFFFGRVSVAELNRRSKAAISRVNSFGNLLWQYSRALSYAEFLIGGVIGWSVVRGLISWFSSQTDMSPEGNASLRKPKPEHQTDYSNIVDRLNEMGISPHRQTPSRFDPKNVWADRANVGLIMEPNNAHSSEQIVRVVERQVYDATFTCGNVEVGFNVVAIAPQFIVTNAHNLVREGGFKPGLLRLALSKLEGGDPRLCRSHTYQITPDDVYDLGFDVALVYLPSFQAKNLTIYLSPELQTTPFFFQHRCKGWLTTGIRTKEVDVSLAAKFTWEGMELPQALIYDYPEHAVGLCGAPIVFTSGRATFIYGIHAAGQPGTPRCLGVPLIKARILEGMEHLRSRFVLTELTAEGCVKLFDIDGGPPIFGNPDDKSFLNWQAGFVDYEATIKNLTYNRPKPKMVFLPTAEHAHKFGVETQNSDGQYKWGIPEFKEFHSDAEELGFYSPYHKWASKAFQSSDYCDLDALYYALDELWRNIEQAEIDWKARPMDPVSVTAGDNKVYTVRSMNASTSMGFGFTGKKDDHMFPLVTEQAPDGKTFTDEVWSHVLEDIATYVGGSTVRPISKASLKVEPRVRELKDGRFTTKQPRVFCATPATDVVIGRMFLLPILDLLKQDRAHCECMVGVNAMSHEWGKIRSYFEKKGVLDSSFGADISGFDTRMLVSVKHAAMTIIMRMAEKAGYSLVEQKVLRGYLTDTLYPLVLVKNDLLTMPNLIVSGRVGTAEFNSLCLSLIYRMVWFSLARDVGSTDNFNDCVQLITYGDDSKAGSKVPWFNQESFCKGCNRFGIVATTASKSEDFEQFVPFDGEEFLHRTWRWDEKYNVWCAPLAFDSMVRSLVLNTASNIGVQAQAFEAAHSINFELAQHGEKVFDEKMARLVEILQDSGLIAACGPPKFKSFDEIMTSCYC